MNYKRASLKKINELSKNKETQLNATRTLKEYKGGIEIKKKKRVKRHIIIALKFVFPKN